MLLICIRITNMLVAEREGIAELSKIFYDYPSVSIVMK